MINIGLHDDKCHLSGVLALGASEQVLDGANISAIGKMFCASHARFSAQGFRKRVEQQSAHVVATVFSRGSRRPIQVIVSSARVGASGERL